MVSEYRGGAPTPQRASDALRLTLKPYRRLMLGLARARARLDGSRRASALKDPRALPTTKEPDLPGVHPHVQLPGAISQCRHRTRRFSRAGVMLIGLVLMLLSVVPAAKADIYNPADWAPMVWSDKADYAPGEQSRSPALIGSRARRSISASTTTRQQLGPRRRRDRRRQTGSIADDFNLPNWFVAELPRDGHGGLGSCCHAHLHGRKSAVGSDRAWDAGPSPRGRARRTPSSVPIAGNDDTCTLDLSASGASRGCDSDISTTPASPEARGQAPSTSLHRSPPPT